MNFGEELAYWYLRLNGFFPLTNYVYHKSESAESSGDCDVLAYRPAGVWEEVGGQEVVWDPRLRALFDFGRRPVVVICEVKTGGFDPRWLFPPDRLRYAYRRAGLPDPGDPELAEWANSRSFDHGSCTSYNLLVAREGGESTRWHTIRIEDCVAFVRERFTKYPQKFRDRIYFQSALIQFLAFESEVERASQPQPRVGLKACSLRLPGGAQTNRPLKTLSQYQNALSTSPSSSAMTASSAHSAA